MTTSPPTQIDPELTRQLNCARPGQLVAGVFVLRTPPARKFLTAAETRTQVQQLLTTAREQSQTREDRLTLFENLQSFALQAPRELLQTVVDSPLIASAMANQQPEGLLMEPIRPTQPSSRGTSRGATTVGQRPTKRPGKTSRRSRKAT